MLIHVHAVKWLAATPGRHDDSDVEVHARMAVQQCHHSTPQDEEDANFTLDDGQAQASPSTATSAPAAGPVYLCLWPLPMWPSCQPAHHHWRSPAACMKRCRLCVPPPCTQLDTERAAQDREDEEIQQRLQQQREAAKADAAARSVSPPVYNRPMSPPPGSAPRTPLPPPGVEPPEFRVSIQGRYGT